MGDYQCYEPILNKNLQELRLGNKKLENVKKIKIFDEDTLAEKLQNVFRYDPYFAIEALKFNYDGYYGKPKHVQKLWQSELRLYEASAFARKPAYKSIFCPTLYDCYLQATNEYFQELSIEKHIDLQMLLNYDDNNVSYDTILKQIRNDIILSYLQKIFASINHIRKDSKANGQVVVFSLLPIKYDEECPSCFSIIQNDIPLMNKQIAIYCKKNNIRFVDIFHLFADKNGQLSADLSDDGLFLNENGYTLLTRIVSRAIENETHNTKPNAEGLPY